MVQLKKSFFFSAKKLDFFESFELKVMLIIALTAIFTALSAFIVIAVQRHNASMNAMKSQSEIIAGYTLDLIDRNIFTEISRHGDESKDLYLKTNRQLDEVRRVSGLKYLYTIKQDPDGTLIYHVDGQPTDTHDYCHTGMPIEKGILEEAERAMAGRDVIANKIKDTGYGSVFTSCWPVKNDRCEVIGALGIEYDAENLTNLDKRALLISFAVIICIIIVMCLIFILMYKNISVMFHQKLAYIDVLTGLSNRMAFELDLKNIHKNKIDSDVVLVVFDLNNLKQVNDAYGHSCGDAYLRDAVLLILSCFMDVGEVYRIGGDEFVLLCLGHDEEYIKIRLTTIFTHKMKAFRERLKLRFPDVNVGVAYGAAGFKGGVHADLHDVFKDADLDMYKTKKSMKENTAEPS